MSSAFALLLLVVGQPSSPEVLTPPGPEIGPDYVQPRATWVYEPPYFTCYSHHRHWLDCYPGFHEQYYRRPYNYRVLFDYPWHESVHGPVPAGGGFCGEAWAEGPYHEPLAPSRATAPATSARRPSLPTRRASYLHR
jgi:hypothetical protein